jgi:cytochrome b
MLAATALSGMGTLAEDEGRDPLAGVVAVPPDAGQVREWTGDEEEHEDDHGESDAGDAWEELHEVAANATLVLVLLHVGGVIWASRAHRENLVRAMFTGRKRA